MNLPNRITLLRIILVPVFMVFAARGSCDPAMMLIAGIVFAAAGFTDFLDGRLARKNNLVTNFGKFADPLADKMLTTAAFLYMMADGVCPPAALAVILFREFAVAGVRMMAASSGTVIAANIWGKIKTVLQMLTILFYYWGTALASSDVIALVQGISALLCWGTALVTLLSGGIYLWQNRACFSQMN